MGHPHRVEWGPTRIASNADKPSPSRADMATEAPRTTPLQALGRMGCVGWMIGILLAKCLIVLGVAGVPIFLLALSGLIGVLAVATIGIVGTRLVLFLSGHHHDPLYRRWLEEGNDPYLSTLPYPFVDEPLEERGRLRQRLTLRCPQCGTDVTEAEPGDFDICGVICPICHSEFSG